MRIRSAELMLLVALVTSAVVMQIREHTLVRAHAAPAQPMACSEAVAPVAGHVMQASCSAPLDSHPVQGNLRPAIKHAPMQV